MSKKSSLGLNLDLTARWTAAVRAKENERENPLIFDPWAAALAGEEGLAWIAQRSEASVVPILLRTRYFDDFLQDLAHEKGIRQLILMAAGMDTRAFRLNWPEQTCIFELDQSPVLKFKENILRSASATPTCARKTIEVDLSSAWEEQLLLAGFDPRKPSGWLLEGFLFYLPNDVITQILDGVTRQAAIGSWLGFDIVNSITLTHPLTKPWVDMQAGEGAPWLGTMDDPVGFLAARGWKARLTQAGQEDAHHGRWPFPVFPTMMPDFPHNWFVTAEKRIPLPAKD